MGMQPLSGTKRGMGHSLAPELRTCQIPVLLRLIRSCRTFPSTWRFMGSYMWSYKSYGGFRKWGVPYFGVLIVRILLFRVLHQGPLFSETPI